MVTQSMKTMNLATVQTTRKILSRSAFDLINWLFFNIARRDTWLHGKVIGNPMYILK